MKRFILILGVILFASVGYAQNLQISGGNNFSAAVCDNQVVYVWGSNTSGQLGVDKDGNPYAAAQSTTPLPVWYDPVTSTGSLPPIRQIDAGSGAHILGLDCSKQVWGWGENNCGQLGRGGVAACGATVGAPVPTRVLRGAQAAGLGDGTYLGSIFYVSGGNNSSYALEEGTGKVLAWGQNTKGQLGDGTITSSSLPVYVKTGPLATDILTNIVQIEGGDNCAYALDANGYVWSWGGEGDAGSLGRPVTGTDNRYARRVQMDLNFDGNADVPAVYLSGIKQISGGDTHGLGLTAAGEVWSWGGDWGPGQRGNGYGYQYQPVAYQVVLPGAGGVSDATAGYKVGPYITGAKYVAAGQASSAVVMSDGRVVTFGANGLFNDPTCPDAGTTADNQISMYPAGTLGNGGLMTQACTTPITRDDNANSAYGAVTPVYVKTGPGATDFLTGIETVSDGDAWFYATNTAGNAYVWGYNARGELGLGGADLTAKNYAVSFNLPSGCSFASPCPGKPNLGSNITTCPGFSTILTSGVPQSYTSWKYTWEYRAGTSGAWSPLGAAMGNNVNYSSATNYGQYRVTVQDNRGPVPFLCGPCPVYMDTITFTAPTNPYTVDACQDLSASMARFTVVNPAGIPIKWFTNYNDPAAATLNPSNTNATITVPFTSTNTTAPGCASGRALYAEDMSSITGALMPAQPCAAAAGNVNGSFYTMITVTQAAQLTNVSFVQGGGWGVGDWTLRISPNTGSLHCNDCSPSGSYAAPGVPVTTIESKTAAQATAAGWTDPGTSANRTWTLATPYSLAPGTYWLEINVSGGAIRPFTCAGVTLTASSREWATPITETNGVLIGKGAAIGNNSANRGALYNIGYTSGATYSCDRILVCVSSNCVLPVEYVSFTAEAVGFSAVLNWVTATELNSDYFIIEKSTDGSTFLPIGRIEAAGNSESMKPYTYTDNSLAAGTISYYRLAQYDIDGSVHYSEVRAVSREGIRNVQVVPNPNNGSFAVYIEGLGESANVTLTLRNSLSQVVYVNTNASGSRRDVNLQDLAAGIYYLEVQSDEGNFITKIVKE